MVQMPTPEAVLRRDPPARPWRAGGRGGVGDVIVVDVGGATTDVHSERALEPAAPGIEDPLLPAPLTLRTVEGDLGLRAGAPGVARRRRALARAPARRSRRQGDARGPRRRVPSGPPGSPTEPAEVELDRLLAVGCATHALARHCGTMLLRPAARGRPADAGPRRPRPARGQPPDRDRRGLRPRRRTARRSWPKRSARRAPRSLSPRAAASSRVDRSYVLAAAGLMETIDPDAAFLLLERELLGQPRVRLEKLDTVTNNV